MPTQQDRLKKIRFEFKLNQSQAAKQIGVTQQTWNNAERGRTNLTRKNAELVAKEFNINLGWLLTGEGSMTGETEVLKNIQDRKLVKLIQFSILNLLPSQFYSYLNGFIKNQFY